MCKSILVVLLFAVALPFQAQSPYLVRDINTTVSFETRSSSPKQFTSYRGRTYFVASAEGSGPELWSTGSNGTSLVADIIPGPYGSDPGGLTVVNDLLLFDARDVDHGQELWASDGTAAGTRLLLDINPGPSSSIPFARIVHGDRLLFNADDGTNGRELWISDGTTAGTRMLLDINPGSASSSPSAFVAFGNSIYFSAAGGLWKTDGTASGTVKIAGVFARLLAVAGGQLFFEGSNGAANWEPWVSDGTEAGTRMIADIIPGSKGSQAWSQIPSPGFTPLGNQVLFLADDGVHGREMWISDGTSAGTRMVRDFLPGAAGMWAERYLHIGALGNRAWFVASDAEHGDELWVTDGTDSGTALFRDLFPGIGSSSPTGFVVSNGKLFFAAQNSNSIMRVWVTDGSVAGTRVLGGAAAPGISPRTITPAGGSVYFPGVTARYGTEPWLSDGTDAGTRLVANIASDQTPSSVPFMLTAANDLLFFYAKEDSPVNALWRSDGTAGGTFRLRESTENPGELEAAGPLLFFSERAGNQRVAMLSDGTIEGTKSSDEFMARFGGREIESFFPFGDTLFASLTIPDRDEAALWKTSVAPNAVAEELGARNPYGLIEVAGHYAFFATGHEGIHSRGLWTTDGTRAGTHAIVPDLGADYQGVSRLVNAAGTIFFVKQERDREPVLWKSDGTLDGTTIVRELPDLAMHRAGIAAAGRRVFIGALRELWVSDGTAEGTIKLTTPELSTFYDNKLFDVAGDRVLFITHTGTSLDLWSSDGTPSGTIRLGETHSERLGAGGLVYYAGSDELHGTELWTTDGTAAGTKMLIDLNPGPASSSPYGYVKAGNTIYFSAYTDATGRELWALPLTEPLLSIGDARTPEGDAAPAVVRLKVTLAPAAQQAVTVHFATANGTAIAGQDYDAAAGTLTFLSGETAKFVDVRVIADSAPENNETFVVTLSDAEGARVLKGEATGIIDDEDQAADLSVVPSFTIESSSLYDSVSVSNLGPRAATDIAVRVTSTPSYGSSLTCSTCLIPQLAVGDSALTGGAYSPPYRQVYLSAIATARQDDPQASNNSASWTVNDYRSMVMSPAWLTTGATGTITATSSVATPSVTSSDPSVVVASAVTKLSEQAVTFTVTALKPGTSRIYLDQQQKSIDVTVAAPGLAPRWPGALAVSTDYTARRFDEPVTVTITSQGVAPMTAATPTGTVIVSASGQELTRGTIGGTNPIAIPLYLPALGANNLQVNYSGDATFLPQSFAASVFVRQGDVSITGTLVRVTGTAGTYTLAMQAAGSPVAAPTGIISVLDGTTELARISLQPSGAGTSRAETTLTNLPKHLTLTLHYAGDSLYRSSSQQIRAADARRRSVRH